MKKFITLMIFAIMALSTLAYADIQIGEERWYEFNPFESVKQTVWGSTATKIGISQKFSVLAHYSGQVGTGTCTLTTKIYPPDGTSLTHYGLTGTMTETCGGVQCKTATIYFNQVGSWMLSTAVSCANGFKYAETKDIAVSQDCGVECIINELRCDGSDNMKCIKRAGEVCASWQINMKCTSEQNCIKESPYCLAKDCISNCAYSNECANSAWDSGCKKLCSRNTDSNSCNGGQGSCGGGMCLLKPTAPITPTAPSTCPPSYEMKEGVCFPIVATPALTGMGIKEAEQLQKDSAEGKCVTDNDCNEGMACEDGKCKKTIDKPLWYAIGVVALVLGFIYWNKKGGKRRR